MSTHSLLLMAQTTPPPVDTTDTLLMWAIVLIGMAVILFVLELFIPSGGIIGGGAAFCLVVGCIVLCFVNTTVGLIVSILFLTALPFAFMFMMKIWPNTPIGRLLILRSEKDEAEESSGEGLARPSAAPSNGLAVGAVGQAMTDLRPIGTCDFDGKREQCLAAGGMIDAGQRVRITAIDGMQVHVRAENA